MITSIFKQNRALSAVYIQPACGLRLNTATFNIARKIHLQARLKNKIYMVKVKQPGHGWAEAASFPMEFKNDRQANEFAFLFAGFINREVSVRSATVTEIKYCSSKKF